MSYPAKDASTVDDIKVQAVATFSSDNGLVLPNLEHHKKAPLVPQLPN